LKSGRLPQAERTYLSVQAIQKGVRGEEHPNSLNTMSSLAHVHLQTWDEKLKLTSWDLFRDQVLLGASLAGQAKYDAAEPLLLAGFDGLMREKNIIPPYDRFYVEVAGPWIVQLYQDWGKPDQAGEWTRRVQETNAANSSK